MDVNNFRFGDPSSSMWGGFNSPLGGGASGIMGGYSNPSDPAAGLASLLMSLSPKTDVPGSIPNAAPSALTGVTTGAQPPVGGIKGFMDKAGLGMNVKTGQLALAGLDTIGSLWGGFAARGLANKNFNFQKDFAEKNYVNQLKSYNTALEDRGRSRAVMEGQSDAEARDYIAKNKLG